MYEALLVAVLVCFFAWQIDVSRTARMYVPSSFFSDRWHLAASLVGISLVVGGVPNSIRVRYVFNAELPVYMMAVLAINVLSRGAGHLVTKSKNIPSSSTSRFASAVGCTLIAVGALATPDLSPFKAFAVTAASEESRPILAPRYALDAWTDRKTTSIYIRDHLQPEDKIAAIDWITVYYYVGRLDYWLRDEADDSQLFGPASAPRDIHVGSRMLHSAATLRAVIGDLCGQTYGKDVIS